MSPRQLESRDNAIKKLICPKQGLLEADTAGKALLRATVQEVPDEKVYDIDIILEDFTLNILVEAILSSLDVVLETVDAVMGMIAAGNPHGPSGSGSSRDPSSGPRKFPRLPPLSPSNLARIHEMEDEDMSEPGSPTSMSASQLREMSDRDIKVAEQESSGLRFKIKLLNPGLILIENARNYDSRAVSMRSTFQVCRPSRAGLGQGVTKVPHVLAILTWLPSDFDWCAWTLTAPLLSLPRPQILYVKKLEGQSGQESVHIDASSLEMYVDAVGGGGAGPVQIVEPFALGAHLKRRSECEKLLVQELLVNLDKIFARVAYHDVMLVMSILNGLSDTATRFHTAQEEERRPKDVNPGALVATFDTAESMDSEEPPPDIVPQSKDTSITKVGFLLGSGVRLWLKGAV